MFVTTACVQRKILLLVLFLTVFITLIYVYNTTDTRPSYTHLHIFTQKPCPSPRSNTNTTFDTFTNFSLIIAVQVHKRSSYLTALISSLSASPDIDKAFLIFSHDYFDDEINSLISNITFCKYKQIFYPYSIEAAPNHTDPKIKPKVSQVKLHWWWKANEVFRIAAYYEYEGLVLFLEEDHFVVEDFMHVLNMMHENSPKHCSNCVYSLGDGSRNFQLRNNKFKTSKKMSNMGLAFNATTWSTIVSCADRFCKYDDYNWDWTLNYIFQECVKPETKTLIMSGNRAFHIGKCGMHFNNKDCDATTLVKDIQDEIFKYSKLLYPKELEYIGETGSSKIYKNFGGFGEKEDQELCVDLSSCELTVSM